ALDNLNSNHWCVCQERLRASPLQKGKKKKTSGYFFIEVLTLPYSMKKSLLKSSYFIVLFNETPVNSQKNKCYS
ncbi:hypothetical protein KGR20_18910, partial [Cytobacillus oceanisediminis]|uniref:hypothetical protein n=1 Tax=Cytobacillus oceanisediminis TaxID=665099 RepID=UPI001CCF4D59